MMQNAKTQKKYTQSIVDLDHVTSFNPSNNLAAKSCTASKRWNIPFGLLAVADIRECDFTLTQLMCMCVYMRLRQPLAGSCCSSARGVLGSGSPSLLFSPLLEKSVEMEIYVNGGSASPCGWKQSCCTRVRDFSMCGA